MKKKSAGILLYRTRLEKLEVLLVHPGGPFWRNKDVGAWTIPKGELGEGEDPLLAALREFEEETGKALSGTLIELTPVTQKSGKLVMAWACEGEIDPDQIKSNGFSIEWPPRSGRMQTFPEIDKAEWFTIGQAKEKMIEAQIPLLLELNDLINKM